MIPRVISAAALFMLIFAPAAVAQEPAPAATPMAVAPALVVPSNPREAGARYGQAAGVSLVCYGMRTTAGPELLKSKYQGEALAAFNDQAGRIVAMWQDILTCKHAGGPNNCRLSHAFSCAEAMKEIGPAGSKLAGLVEAKPEGTAAAVAPEPATAPKP